MTIDWTNFTPWSALAGGILLGLAAAALILASGRILGISGIVGGLVGQLFKPQAGEAAWRLAFLAGLLASPWVYAAFATPAAPRIAAGPALLIAAGLLVGIGTRYASGCTSGHGVCGLSQLSPRSLVATLSFMAAGFVTVGLLRHVF
jgi:uncharacterized membrane protein YedE/YeeE